MDWGQFSFVFFTYSILWIVAQRLAIRHQRTFRIFITLFAMLWFWLRSEPYFWEMLLGFIASLFMSFLFWLLIGRYNPVGNDDEDTIKVYGLDD